MCNAVDYRDFQPADSGRTGENIEWSINYAYNKKDTSGAPRVIVIGDSICNAYSDMLRKKIGGKMNFSYWASSLCVRDPLYFKTLDLVLDGPRPDLVIFNNILHSGKGNDDAWRIAFRQALLFIMAKLPEAKVAVLNGTPMRADEEWVVEKNAIAAEVAAELELPLVDLYGFCYGWDRKTAWRDACHFSIEYVEKQAGFMGEKILALAGLSDGTDNVVQKGTALGPNGRLD